MSTQIFAAQVTVVDSRSATAWPPPRESSNMHMVPDAADNHGAGFDAPSSFGRTFAHTNGAATYSPTDAALTGNTYLHSPPLSPIASVMATTISPVEIFPNGAEASGGYVELNDNQFYYVLDFPDFQYQARKATTVIGRGPDAEDLHERNLDQVGLLDSDSLLHSIQLKRKRDFDDSDLSDNESEGSYKKRKQTNGTDHDGKSWEEDMEDVPRDDTKHHLTQVGGIGGPQFGSTDPSEHFVGIHPEIDEDTGEMSIHSISRRHLRIHWNEDHGWILQVLGRNGCFVNETHFEPNTDVALEDADLITLRGIQFAFYIPTDEDLESEADETMDGEDTASPSRVRKILLRGGKSVSDEDLEDDEMNDELEDMVDGDDDEQEDEDEDEDDDDEEDDEDDDNNGQETNIEKAARVKKQSNREKPAPPPMKPVKLKLKLSAAKKQPKKEPISEQQQDEEEAEASEEPTAEKSQKLERQDSTQATGDDQDPPGSAEAPSKRRGPGRPPADGVMSKRERRERQKAAEAGVPYGTPLPVKPKPKPKEGEVVDDAVATLAAAAKKPKKPKKDGDGVPTADAEDESGDKNKKTSAEPPPPRPPTPKESDYTPEMLQKPDDTYQGLLYTLLSEVKEPMALPEIYEAMKNKWPYFRFGKESKGWESSVRHNLQSCKCFEKVQRAGKGWRWVINPAHPFERKSKRASEPNPAAAYGSRYPPVHNIGANPYAYHVGYPAGSVQQISFANGNRPSTVGPQPFTPGQPSTSFNQQAQPGFANGQRPPLPAQMQPGTNYASPYTTNGASGQNPNQPGINSAPSQNNGQSTYSLHQTSFQNGGLHRIPPTTPSAYAQPHASGAQAPIPMQGVAPPRFIEPPAIDEIRAGRIPAVVKRFLLQLRKISGVDAEKTLKQAELAIQFIVKHPDGNGASDPEREGGAPKSMVEVIRGLIWKQSSDARALMAQAAVMPQAQLPRMVQPPTPLSRTVQPSPASLGSAQAVGLVQQKPQVPQLGAAQNLGAPQTTLSGPPTQSLPLSTSSTPLTPQTPVIGTQAQGSSIIAFPTVVPAIPQPSFARSVPQASPVPAIAATAISLPISSTVPQTVSTLPLQQVKQTLPVAGANHPSPAVPSPSPVGNSVPPKVEGASASAPLPNSNATALPAAVPSVDAKLADKTASTNTS